MFYNKNFKKNIEASQNKNNKLSGILGCKAKKNLKITNIQFVLL
jgi:hypothetical protein